MSTGPAGGRIEQPTGLLLATGIGAAWFASLVLFLQRPLDQLLWWQILAGLLARTQLQTGLFIIGHDAMHRVLLPGRTLLNDRLGALALGLYAGLPYGICRTLHRRHHRLTATAADPDFPHAARSDLFSWYRQFMAGYLTVPQMSQLLFSWAAVALCFQLVNPSAVWNLLIFCTAPLLLSSWQLFLFGTYLPHRRQRSPESDLRPQSLDWPVWLSWLACYHFGYHREHPDHPQHAWFELPALRRR